LDEQGLPDLADLFAANGPAAKVTARKTATVANASVKRKSVKRSAREPATPTTVALAGLHRHGVFAANGIPTLEEAAAYSESGLTAIPGIGPGLIAVLKDALPRASLEFRAEGT
jgi:predicted flap endonuclease-1-like 5' DNA nuclease